jgi:transcriptional regulator with XRE-family HTH domain
MATTADGPVIRRLREAQGLNGTQLAHAAGISRYYLSRLERGQRQGSPAVRLRIARALNVPLSEITKSVDPEPSVAAAA